MYTEKEKLFGHRIPGGADLTKVLSLALQERPFVSCASLINGLETQNPFLTGFWGGGRVVGMMGYAEAFCCPQGKAT